ncbi:hypothetical protein RYX36_002820 [Vicia faba]
MDKPKALKDEHFNTILNRKRSAEARRQRKIVLQFKRAKILRSMNKENAQQPQPNTDEETSRIRLPLSTISPNIPSCSMSAQNTLQKTHPNSVLNTLPSTLTKRRTKVMPRWSINNIGVNLTRRFDNVFSHGASISLNKPLQPGLQINKLFPHDSRDEESSEDSSEGFNSNSNSFMDDAKKVLIVNLFN